jgi:hypothetical protein
VHEPQAYLKRPGAVREVKLAIVHGYDHFRLDQQEQWTHNKILEDEINTIANARHAIWGKFLAALAGLNYVMLPRVELLTLRARASSTALA